MGVLGLLLPVSHADTAVDYVARRDRLEGVYREQCQQFLEREVLPGYTARLQRVPDRNLFYAAPVSSQANPELVRLHVQYAASLSRLADAAAASGQGAFAYQLLHQAAAFDPASAAHRVLGSSDPRIVGAVARTDHRRLPWGRGKYWRITSEHFQISTNRSEQEGLALAARLETLYRVWRQCFFDYWSEARDLQLALRRSRVLRPRSPKHRVVLFANRAQYVEHLQSRQPRIALTLGFYDTGAETSYFFAGEEGTEPTHLHEVTHQLFHEAQAPRPRANWRTNFWVIEGVAMYMESMQQRGPVAELGGLAAERLQFARYRRLQEGFSLPLAQLVMLGQRDVQEHPDIRRLYSQSAGLVHFLMDAGGGKYRGALMQYLRQIYAGRDRADSLASLTGAELGDLDEEYRAFLQVEDEVLKRAGLRLNAITSLCLGKTQVSDEGIRSVPPQAQLRWLDVGFTSITDRGLEHLLPGKALVQLSVQGTGIGDRMLERLRDHPVLEELDLSSTAITDGGVTALGTPPALTTLWLDDTQVSDAILDDLLQMPRLNRLGIAGTRISEAGRARLKRLRPGLAIDE